MSEYRLTLDGHEVVVKRPDKVLFADLGLTKRELVDYYRDVASLMLPHLAGRPLALMRFPDGVGHKRFFQQSASDYFPDFVGRTTVAKKGGEITHPMVDNAAALAYLAGQAALELHRWQARVDRPAQPDVVLWDFDPSGDDFEGVRLAARATRAEAEAAGLVPFLMTSGSRGLHIIAPIRRGPDFDEVGDYGFALAERVAAQHPDRLTTEFKKADRKGRVFLDATRNRYAQLAVCPYSVRGRPTAPVATPLTWEELDDPTLTAQSHTVRDLRERLEKRGDVWDGFQDAARELS